MSETAPKPQAEPIVLISNLSLPLGVQMLGGVEKTAGYIDDIGANGMELTPSKRGRFMKSVYECADVFGQGAGGADWRDFDASMTGIVQSLHASPRDARDPKFDLLGRVMFPHFADSLRTMNHVQFMVGRKLPAVVFPGHSQHYDNSNAPFREILFQPKPYEWKHMFQLPETAELEEVQNVMSERGLTGVTWDVFHSQNPQEGVVFSNALSLASRLASAGMMHSVHVALDRQDCAEKHSIISKTTAQAREAFADPKSSVYAARTLEGEMLSEVARSWKAGNVPKDVTPTVVVEMLPGASTSAARKEHEAVVANIYSIIAAA